MVSEINQRCLPCSHTSLTCSMSFPVGNRTFSGREGRGGGETISLLPAPPNPRVWRGEREGRMGRAPPSCYPISTSLLSLLPTTSLLQCVREGEMIDPKTVEPSALLTFPDHLGHYCHPKGPPHIPLLLHLLP
jgi:hypothetical protein